jgi:pyruvate kinase
VLAIREFLSQDAARHGRGIKIISKIENQEGLDNFDEILAVSDGIMVARGDLGVEIPLERVALAQKMMIAKCLAAGKMVVTATQMLETMHTQPFPTRAEATDVANAVFDGTDCVMLSGETAKGMYPIEACSRMAKICQAAESVFDNQKLFEYLHQRARCTQISTDEAIVLSAVKVANALKATLIVTYTNSGHTARLVAKYRPSALVFAMTPFDRTARQLLGIRGVFPFIIKPDDASSLPTPTTANSEGEWNQASDFGAPGSAAQTTVETSDSLTREGVDFEAILFESMNMARARGLVRVGDFVVVVRSWSSEKNSSSNVLRILTVPPPQVAFEAV